MENFTKKHCLHSFFFWKTLMDGFYLIRGPNHRRIAFLLSHKSFFARPFSAYSNNIKKTDLYGFCRPILKNPLGTSHLSTRFLKTRNHVKLTVAKAEVKIFIFLTGRGQLLFFFFFFCDTTAMTYYGGGYTITIRRNDF